ncbi:MAG: hypothetical protein WB777_10255 [Mycobacterium sp.]
MKAAGGLGGAAGQATGATEWRWSPRSGSEGDREAADGLIVNTGHQDQVVAEISTREGALRTAVVYRTHAKALKAECEQANYGEPDEVQFEMCEFTDGRVAQRWRVVARSCVWWDSLRDLYTIHIYAHPEYGTRVEWSDGKVEEL